MTKVYAVAQGAYSDYRVGPIFSTPEKAQEYIDRLERRGIRDYPEIEEYELDDTGEPAYGVFQVAFGGFGLETKWVNQEHGYRPPRLVDTPTELFGDIYGAEVWEVLADKRADAEKIAQDARAQRKAEEAGL